MKNATQTESRTETAARLIAEIMEKLNEVEQRVQDTKASETTWGDIGDLQHLRHQLDEILGNVE